MPYSVELQDDSPGPPRFRITRALLSLTERSPTRSHMSLHQIRQRGGRWEWELRGGGGGDKHTGIRLRVQEKRLSVFFFRGAGTNSLFCPEAMREWSDGSAQDLHPPTANSTITAKTSTGETDDGGAEAKVYPIEAPLTATVVLDESAAYLRGNLPHYGCDYFQITNQSNSERALIGSSSGLQMLAGGALTEQMSNNTHISS